MTVTITRDDEIKVISFDGHLDVATSDQTREEAINLLTDKPTIIDLEKCGYVSSSGLRSLLMIAKTAKARKIPFAYAAAIDEVVDVLQMTGFLKMLKYFDTMEQAEEFLRSNS